MTRRLLEQDYFRTTDPTPARLAFWLAEMRTPEILVEPGARFPEAARLSPRLTAFTDVETVRRELAAEEQPERAADTADWLELKREPERLRGETRRAIPPPPTA